MEMQSNSSPDGSEPIRLNLLWDNVFKAVFTKDLPASREALRHLLSALIKREVAMLTVIANEPAVDSFTERQIRYDIACTFNDGELANVEMTLYPDKYEPVRMEYYSCKLFIGQELRGKDKQYQDLRQTYQISFLVNKKQYDDDALMHQFVYYDEEHGKSLGGRTSIITVELAKVEKIAQKAVAEMTPVESWAVYLRYNADETKQGLLEAITEKNKGVAMAQEVFLTVSRDEKERARLLSEYKFAVDLQSRMITAREDGIEIGTVKGIEIGTVKGIEIGTVKGIEIGGKRALDLMRQGYSPDEIERQLAGR